MASNYSDRYKLELQETGANANTWGNNTNTNLETIDAFTGGYLSKSVAGSSNVTLTTNNADPNAETSNKVIEFTGTLTGDITVFIPAVESNYIFFNNTSGAHTLTIAPTGHGSNGSSIAQGAHTIQYCTGTRVTDLFANSIGTFSVKESLTVNGTVISSDGTVNATTYSGNGSSLTGVSSIPSGTTALFYQGSAPTGWTQNTASSINDCCLRVVTGSGGGTGGSTGFTTTLPASKNTGSKSVGIPISNPVTISLGNLGNTTLSTPTIASHSHGGTMQQKNNTGVSSDPENQGGSDWYGWDVLPGGTSNNTGGGGAHAHPLGSSNITAATPSISTSNHSLSIPNMQVKYENIIAATKD